MRLRFRLERAGELERQLDEAGLDMLDYGRRGRRYRLRVTELEMDLKRELLTRLLKRAYDRSSV